MIIAQSELHTLLERTKADNKIYTVLSAKNNMPTMKLSLNEAVFFLHSKYDPIAEAEKFADLKYAAVGSIFLYGLGFGYNVKAIHNRLKSGQKLFILESCPEVVKAAFQNTDIKEYIENSDNIIFRFAEDMKTALDFIISTTNQPKLTLVIHEPSLRIMPEKLNKLKDVLHYFLINQKSVLKFNASSTVDMSFNKEYNNSQGYENGAMVFHDKYRDKAVVIIAAGTSLSQSIDEMKKNRDKAVYIAVGRVAKQLEENGFFADYYIQTDAQASTWRRLEPTLQQTPLFMLESASYELTKYCGQKYILYTEPHNDDFCIEYGGSVTTAAISLAAVMGSKKIIFIGYDLCYWSENQHSNENDKFIRLKNNTTVEAIDGRQCYTTQNLYSYLRWTERFIANHKQQGISFINSTVYGAKISGAPNLSLTCALSEQQL